MYAEQNINRDEIIIQKAQIHPASVVNAWIIFAIFGIIAIISGSNMQQHYYNSSYTTVNGFAAFCFILSILFVISFLSVAIAKTITLKTTELAVTNKKIIGKLGLVNTKSMDAPLNKIQNISVSSGLGGKMFGYGNISISTASGNFNFKGIRTPDVLKNIIMEQVDIYEKNESKKRAEELAMAMMMNQNNNSAPKTVPQTVPQNAVVFCSKCGSQNSPQANFCKSCGEKL